MKKRIFIYPSLLISSLGMAQTGPEHPNIIFILADDLGYGDLSCLNERGKIKTPNLDRLANDGVVFTDAHSSSAVSTPTRYGILTGRYNWRSTLKSGVLGIYNKPIIPTDRTTLPVMLRSRNYQTACIGKWHLGMNYPTTDGRKPVDNETAYNLDFSKQITGGPCEIGFDYFFGVDAPNYPPYCFIENRQTLDLPDTFYPVNKDLDCREGRGKAGWDLEDILPVLETKAVEYIHKAAKTKEPFFLYFPLTSPHTPIVPVSGYKDRSGLNLYADFVMQTDAVVGSIMKALEDNNITGNTLIIFTSDNGCSPQADFEELNAKNHNPSYIFRGMKSDLFEGGHRIPCIVRWPEKVKPHAINQTICLTDFMATFAAITGYKIADYEGEDSYSLLPLLLDTEEKEIIREATVHHSIDGSFTIRQDKWKLLLSATSGGWSEPRNIAEGSPAYQLYNMEADIEEKYNVCGDYPGIVRSMYALLAKYIREGRSTPGLPQSNDGEYPWKQLSWMEEP